MREPGAALTVVVVYPDLLGTYGDGGNGLVLARRAEWRGFPVQLVEAPSDQPLPRGDLYCLGGGEDGPQARAVKALEADGTLVAAVECGAVVLAVCAGFQIVGRSFPAADGRALPGLGLLDVETVKGRKRAVGEVLVQPGPVGQAGPLSAGPLSEEGPRAASRLPALTGFENHAGLTALGPSVQPLGRVEVGVGNGDGTEGAIGDRIVGTYLHGPVLARNPALADLLLGWALGEDGPLAPLNDREENALRAERLSAVRRIRGRRRFGLRC